MIVAQSGIGKSSLLLQLMTCFALGRSFAGLSPKFPLKGLMIQAENNRLDMAEPLQGIAEGLELSDIEKGVWENNLAIISEDTHSGDDFVEWLDKTVAAFMPIDYVAVDPLLSYIGCDLNRQGDVSRFLRNRLNPVIHKHGIGIVVVHHTPKIKKKESADDYDLSYIGSGSSELTNWARAISVISRDGTGRPIQASFEHVKRDGRLTQRSASIRHADGLIFWETDENRELDRRIISILKTMPEQRDRRASSNGRRTPAMWLETEAKITAEEADKYWDAARRAGTRYKTKLHQWEHQVKSIRGRRPKLFSAFGRAIRVRNVGESMQHPEWEFAGFDTEFAPTPELDFE